MDDHRNMWKRTLKKVMEKLKMTWAEIKKVMWCSGMLPMFLKEIKAKIRMPQWVEPSIHSD